ncbi:MAG TPA: formylglycine-generating enzyme family protein [Caulobacterales bacterium]|nr:formylglycine-generating enzyme family protein [Caulobacterales bacterium]
MRMATTLAGLCALVLIFSAGASGAKSPAPGRTIRDCAECPDMVVIPGGTFSMGSSPEEAGHDADESPQHVVSLQSFAVGKYAVTVAEYSACVAARQCPATEWQEPGSVFNAQTGSDDYYRKMGAGLTGANRPVVGVSCNDANSYAKWLSGKTKKRYRLLTEAEWEYAKRAGTATPYYWGSTIGAGNANCAGCGSQWDGEQPSPVGSFAANSFGVYDMAGNVWQWVEDCYHESYAGSPGDGAAWTGAACARRVLRGGSWSSSPRTLRSADRHRDDPSNRVGSYGFRVARTL